jgi:hypothetical protein
VKSGSSINSSTYAKGNAGGVKVTAATLTIDGAGSTSSTGIASNAETGSTGQAGTVELDVSSLLTVANGGFVTSSTFGPGAAGEVKVKAGRATLEGGGGIFSATAGDGAAGKIEVTVADTLNVKSGSSINSSTYAKGNAGGVKVTAATLTIDGAGSTSFTGIDSNAGTGSTGQAGTVELDVSGLLTVANDGIVTSSTAGPGAAGEVKVKAGRATLEGGGGIFSATEGDGAAGKIEITVADTLTVKSGGLIDSSTYAKGNAGGVKVTAGTLTIDGAGSTSFTGIDSNAETGSTGQAGTVELDVSGLLTVANGGVVTSNTAGAGAAGGVFVKGGALLVDGATISSRAESGSSGESGVVIVDIQGDATIKENGGITAANVAGITGARAAQLNPYGVAVRANSLRLNGGSISATANGDAPAGGIYIEVRRGLSMDGSSLINNGLVPSSIRTSAVNGHGGDIEILAGPLLRIDSSGIITSVTGTLINRNGGNIKLTANTLALNTGVIQANTSSSGGSGGDIYLDVKSLLTSHGSLLAGGTAIRSRTAAAGHNVIQAAAPTGLSGHITINAPALDLSGSLMGLTSAAMPSERLGKSPCQASGGSSLSSAGRGGLPPPSDQPAGAPTTAARPGPPLAATLADGFLRLAAASPCIAY